MSWNGITVFILSIDSVVCILSNHYYKLLENKVWTLDSWGDRQKINVYVVCAFYLF